MTGIYQCPRTTKPLEESNGTLLCHDGSVSYSIEDGIPNFLSHEPVESPEDSDRLRRLSNLARDKGWNAALHEVYSSDPKFYQYVTDERRLGFMDILDITPTATVFELGPGLGQMTTAMAARAAAVHALEVVPAQAAFTLTRCRQSGQDNVTVACGGDDCLLPYRDGTFDIAVCNLVFEWCGSRDFPERPDIGQRRLLQEFVRVLKPGGQLFLHTKNRFSLRHLLDNTAAVKAVSREQAHGRLTKLWLAMSGRDWANGVLYSHNGLRRLLTANGFGEIKSFWAAPEMRYPSSFVPSDSSSVRKFRRSHPELQADTKGTRMVMPLIPAPLVRHVTPGLTFVARRHGTPTAAPVATAQESPAATGSDR